ncbi:MAG: hypothetical protein NT026_00535, partial [Candidatus Staskawiczbacteria bacterium]|nr:hypothetical protein [Candidatus Staskawiczbacteria bacterium]
MVLKNIGLETSRKRVVGREEILKAIFDFVKSVVPKHGTEAKLEGRGSNIRMVRELDNFNNLYFVWSVNSRLATRDNIQISFGPFQDKRCLVFSADYINVNGVEECQINFFLEEPKWQEALAYAINHKDEVAAQWRARQSQAQQIVKILR